MGALAENAFLDFVARAFDLRFTTSKVVARLKFADDVLERLPVRFAEKYAAIPISWDKEKETLAVVVADPSEETITRIREKSGARTVVPVVALHRVVQAAIRKAYYADPTAFGVDGEPDPVRFPCPGCGARVSSHDFQCPRCELLLNAEAEERSGLTEPSVVRALLDVPQSTPGRGIRTPEHNPFEAESTVPAAHLPSEAIPAPVPGYDIAAKPLHPFEAFVASFADGAMPLSKIAEAVGISLVETRVVFQSLETRGAVRISRPGAKPPPPPPQALAVKLPPPPPSPAPRDEEPTPRPVAPPPLVGGNIRLLSGKDVADKKLELSTQVLKQAHQFERSGRVDEAIRVLERGMGQVPHPEMLYNRLALCLINQRKDYLQAQALLEKAVEMDPDNEVYRRNLMKVLILRGS